jgi:hypothetical protein
MAKPKKLELANIGGGELAEIVERELSKICENIADPNVKAEGKRELTIKVAFRPDKKRQTAEVAYSVKNNMPGPDTSKTTAFIAMDGGELGLYGMDLNQQELFSDTEPLTSEIRPVSQLPRVAHDEQKPKVAAPNTN